MTASGGGGSSSHNHHHVRVVARIRPLSQSEQERGSKETISSMQQQDNSDASVEGEPELIETHGGNKRWFELDAVFDPSSTQSQVYVKSGARRAVCDDIFKGYNATILAYGQTGSGKTFTMGTAVRGNGSTNVQEEDGMIPRACIDLFDQVAQKCDGNAQVELSYLEIYNEEVRDLLSSSENASLKIRENLNGEVYVSGLTAKPVSCPNDIGQLMEEASKKRVVGSTAMNAVSSRSHAICTLRISGMIESDSQVDKFTSKLTLVDLAGSERIKKTGAQGNRRQEGISINKGLFVLGQVVSALSGSSKTRPPYRESKLTRLLQNSLGGNSRTIMVACVSPADFNMEESINTLRYATSARKIKSNATRNIVKNISPEEAAALRRENQLLKNEVAELRETVKRLTQSGLRMDSAASLDSCMNTSRDDDSVVGTQVSSDSLLEDPSLQVTSLEQQVATLKKQLRKSQAGLQETTRDAAIELPAMKVELEMLREKVKASQELEEENSQLMQQFEEAKSDADSARIAAAKLSAILDQLKELRRDEIDKKKEDLKYMKKDEAWVVFMETLLEGRADRMKSLSQDFELVMKVLRNPAALAHEEEEQRTWWGKRKGTTVNVLDPELREKVIREHLEFFQFSMGELQQDITMESQSLKDMRVSIQKDCNKLQAEIGKDESKEERIDKVGQKDMLAKLKKVWASNRSLASP